MANIKKGDTVIVISGKREYKGKTGEVLEVIVERNRVIVQGINMVTKHVKVGETNRGTKTGGIETMESPIHVSNVALIDPKSKKPTRVGFRIETVTKNGKDKIVRVRFAKKSGEKL
jgi:large subunit ribosomal protein L24